MEHEILSWLASNAALIASVAGVGAFVYFAQQKSSRDARREREADRERQHRERLEDQERLEQKMAELRKCIEDGRREDREERQRERLEHKEEFRAVRADIATLRSDVDRLDGRFEEFHAHFVPRPQQGGEE